MVEFKLSDKYTFSFCSFLFVNFLRKMGNNNKKLSSKNPVDLSMFSKAIFGGGCFWCTETLFAKLRGVQKV